MDACKLFPSCESSYDSGLAWLSLALLSPAAYVHCLCAHVSYWLMLLVREPEEEVITWYVVGYSWIRVLEFGIISHKNLGR